MSLTVERKEGQILVAAINGDAESWRAAVLLVDTGQDDAEAMHEAQVGGEHYGGPGRSFYGAPYVQRNGHSILITQSGGLDI